MSSLGKRTGLKFGKVSSLFIFYNITITRLFPLDGFRFIILLHDGENDLYFTVEICHCGPLPSATPGFRFGKNFANQQNIKDAVVLGWGRQVLEKWSQTMGITAVTVIACQCNMKKRY